MAGIVRGGGRTGPGWLDIHEEAVQSYIRPGGELNDLLNDVAQGAWRFSQEYISGGGHVRSGRLLGGLYWNKVKVNGPLTGFSRAGSAAKHTPYFHDGTPDVIMAGARGFMLVPTRARTQQGNPVSSAKGLGSLLYKEWAGGGPGKRVGKRQFSRKQTVSGQRAKPFLQEGLAYALAQQGLT